MKRRIVSCILICCLLCSLLVSFTGCGNNEEEQMASGDDVVVETDEMDTDLEADTAEDEQEQTHVELSEKEWNNPEWAAILLSADTLVPSSTELIMRDVYPDFATATQAGWTDGTYLYETYVQIDSASDEMNNKSVIVKYDLETGEQLQTSDYLQLNHTNDMTYNSKLGQLVVCHNKPAYNVVSFIDIETLEYVDSIVISRYISSIAYDEKTDRYACQISGGGQKFIIYDGEFNEVSEVIAPTTRTKGYTTQGAACDEDFIYFALYNENVITVYDWDGNFITVIEEVGFLTGQGEPENVSVINGEIYVAGQGGGAILKVFKLSDFVAKPNTEE